MNLCDELRYTDVAVHLCYLEQNWLQGTGILSLKNKTKYLYIVVNLLSFKSTVKEKIITCNLFYFTAT